MERGHHQRKKTREKEWEVKGKRKQCHLESGTINASKETLTLTGRQTPDRLGHPKEDSRAGLTFDTAHWSGPEKGDLIGTVNYNYIGQLPTRIKGRRWPRRPKVRPAIK